MIPAFRFYYLLILLTIIALLLATFFDLEFSVGITVISDLILLGIAVWDGNKVKQYPVKITRQPLFKLSIGRENPIVLSVKIESKAVQLQIKDYYPVNFLVSSESFKLNLNANSQQDLIYTVTPLRRGEFSWGDIQVRQLSDLRLMWSDKKIPASQKVAVYPDLIGLKSLSIRLAIENTGTMRQVRRLGQGTEFCELREYHGGDDTRMIDWKATARRSRPIVRVLEPEREQTLIILLDRGRLMTAQIQGIQRFDWGLNATLSLALAGLNRGDRVGIAVFDRDVTTWIPPERGQQQLSQIIERVTALEPVLLEPDYMGAVTKVLSQQSRRALVVVITDIVDEIASAELLSALTKLQPRYLPFCVTLRDPQLDVIAQRHSHHLVQVQERESNQTPSILEVYQRAVALDLLAQRELVFATLKQKGVLVLDANVNQISEEIVTRYLQLKARNLL
jgi:uncharacterized protein (DUF58 family)